MNKSEMFKTRPNSQQNNKDEKKALMNLKKLYAHKHPKIERER